jgi:hypothetical protein
VAPVPASEETPKEPKRIRIDLTVGEEIEYAGGSKRATWIKPGDRLIVRGAGVAVTHVKSGKLTYLLRDFLGAAESAGEGAR